MSAPVLLRVLLCLLLVLNGAGSAVAAVQMTMEHAAPDCHSADAPDAAAPANAGQATMAHHPATGSASPCHDAMRATQFASHTQSPPDDAGDGCCDSEQCACLQQVLATGSPEALPAATPDARRASRHPPAGHVPPTLAHLIRPPIG